MREGKKCIKMQPFYFEAHKLNVVNQKVMKELKDTVQKCGVCLDRPSQLYTKCAHQVCVSCINRWLQCSNTCPLCRVTFKSHSDFTLISTQTCTIQCILPGKG